LYLPNDYADPQVLNNFKNCCSCLPVAATDLNKLALLEFTADTPVFVDEIIPIMPSKTLFPVDVFAVPVPVPPLVVPAAVVFAVVVSVTVGALVDALVVLDVSLLFVFAVVPTVGS
jgi:hypothetical protein